MKISKWWLHALAVMILAIGGVFAVAGPMATTAHASPEDCQNWDDPHYRAHRGTAVDSVNVFGTDGSSFRVDLMRGYRLGDWRPVFWAETFSAGDYHDRFWMDVAFADRYIQCGPFDEERHRTNMHVSYLNPEDGGLRVWVRACGRRDEGHSRCTSWRTY